MMLSAVTCRRSGGGMEIAAPPGWCGVTHLRDLEEHLRDLEELVVGDVLCVEEAGSYVKS